MTNANKRPKFVSLRRLKLGREGLDRVADRRSSRLEVLLQGHPRRGQLLRTRIREELRAFRREIVLQEMREQELR